MTTLGPASELDPTAADGKQMQESEAPKQEFSVQVFSDMHLAASAEDGTADYQLDDAETAGWLRQALQRNDWVVLNGDIFECQQPNLRSLASGELGSNWRQVQAGLFRKVARRYPLTVELIETEERLIYVTGNHDAIVGSARLLNRTRPEWVWQPPVGGWRVHFAHGHQADAFNSSSDGGCCSCCCGGGGGGRWSLWSCLSCVGPTVTCCVGAGEQLIDPDFDLTLSKLQAVTEAWLDSNSRVRLQGHAARLAAQHNYDAVIYSHTHHSETATLLSEPSVQQQQEQQRRQAAAAAARKREQKSTSRGAEEAVKGPGDHGATPRSFLYANSGSVCGRPRSAVDSVVVTASARRLATSVLTYNLTSGEKRVLSTHILERSTSL